LRRALAWGCEPHWMWIYPWIISLDVGRTVCDRSGRRGRKAVRTRPGGQAAWRGLQVVVWNRVIAYQSAAAYH